MESVWKDLRNGYAGKDIEENKMIEELKDKEVSREIRGRGLGRKAKTNANTKTIEESFVDVKDKEQFKFFVDLRYEREDLEIILRLLKDVNNKPYGRSISFKDLAVYAVTRLTQKDLEKIQDLSLSPMDRVQVLLNEHNEKNKTALELGEFLVKKLNL